MAFTLCVLPILSPFPSPSTRSSGLKLTRSSPLLASSSSSSSRGSTTMEGNHTGGGGGGRQKLLDFPYLIAPHRNLMVDLISTAETRLASQLLPCSVPPDVEFYQNQTGDSQGTLHLRKGDDSSPIDFMLASWLHLKIPNGGAMDITNLQFYLNPTTDAPHFQFEFVQMKSYFIFFLDFTPRKDTVLHPDYLKKFYEDTKLDEFRIKLQELVPEAKPYFSSSIYFRGVISPTGIMVSFECKDNGDDHKRPVTIIEEAVGPISREVLNIWLEKCVASKENNKVEEESERKVLRKRDFLIKSRAVEMDLSSSMPKQFGEEVAHRVLGVIRDVFNI